jgi:Uma2 family endonuclease
MPIPNPQTKFTYEDYLLFPDDGKRHELIGGDHYVTPSPIFRHQRVCSNLHRMLSSFVHDKRLGHVLTAPFDVVLSDLDVLQPDLLFVSSARIHIITEKNIQGPPDLVIEILSETTRRTDEVVKRKQYERFGVSEYWIVDPELETVKVYRMTGQGYQRTAELAKESGDTLSTPLLPNLQLPLAAIFE